MPRHGRGFNRPRDDDDRQREVDRWGRRYEGTSRGRDEEGGGGYEGDFDQGHPESLRDRDPGGYTGRGPGYEGYGHGGGDELRRLRAADLMTENPETVTPDVSLAEAARRMRDLDVGIIPVVDADGSRRLRGVITDRDIAIRAVADGLDGQSTRVAEVMTTRVETCNKNDPVHSVLRVMEREQVRRVPITDREGRLVGIIAQADVALDLDQERSEQRLADTLERISEPGRNRERMRSRERPDKPEDTL